MIKVCRNWQRIISHSILIFTTGKLRIRVEGIQGLEEALKAYNVIGDDEASLCVSFLRSMLRLKPSDRASPADLTQHKWLKV